MADRGRATKSCAPEPPTSVGDHEEGQKLLERAIQLDNGYPQNHLLLGEAHLKECSAGRCSARKLDAAEHEYQTVLRMQPQTQTAWAHRYPKWRDQAEQGLKRVNSLRRQTASDRGAPF